MSNSLCLLHKLSNVLTHCTSPFLATICNFVTHYLLIVTQRLLIISKEGLASYKVPFAAHSFLLFLFSVFVYSQIICKLIATLSENKNNKLIKI